MRPLLLLLLLASCTVVEPTSETQSAETTAGQCFEDQLEDCRTIRDVGNFICNFQHETRQYELKVHKADPEGFFAKADKYITEACYQNVADAYAACEVAACDAYAQTQP